MQHIKPYKVPPRNTLILLTALAIAILFSLPRLALLRQASADILKTGDFLLRTAYSLLIAITFLTLNTADRKIRLGRITVDLSAFWQRIVLSILLYVLLRGLLIRFHLSVADPFAPEKVFRFVFSLYMLMEVILSFLIAQIYRMIFYNYRVSLANAALLKTNAETRYEVLKNQVNPHFLFNSFSTINALIQSDQAAAVAFVNNMSDVFRYVLKSSNLEKVRLGEEAAFIEAYTAMLLGRYGSKVSFRINIPPALMRKMIPPMALQILVENAVKHNIAAEQRPLTVDISVTGDNRLTVSNNLQKKKVPEPSTGLGLHNLNQRFQYLSNQEIDIRQTDTHFSVTIPLLHETADH